MSHQSDLISQDIVAYLAQHERKELLRFLTCGNVDDGKSTLIGRLLHDSKMIYEDHLEAITRDSKKSGTTGDDIDLALHAGEVVLQHGLAVHQQAANQCALAVVHAAAGDELEGGIMVVLATAGLLRVLNFAVREVSLRRNFCEILGSSAFWISASSY